MDINKVIQSNLNLEEQGIKSIFYRAGDWYIEKAERIIIIPTETPALLKRQLYMAKMLYNTYTAEMETLCEIILINDILGSLIQYGIISRIVCKNLHYSNDIRKKINIKPLETMDKYLLKIDDFRLYKIVNNENLDYEVYMKKEQIVIIYTRYLPTKYTEYFEIVTDLKIDTELLIMYAISCITLY